MKKMVIPILLLTGVLLAAGCTTQSSGSGSPASTPLPMDGHATIGSGSRTLDVSVDSFEVGSVYNTGDRDITVYVAAHNTGTEPERMVWFSRLTDDKGKSFGGIGISHAGSGARSGWIQPNMTELARDYVTIHSDQELAELANGAVLDVYFMERPSDNVTISRIPDYHVSWTIDPGVIH